MPAALKLLGQVQLGVALTTIYTAPAQPPNALTKITGIWVCNCDNVPRTCTLRMGSGTLTIANSLGEAWAIPANTTFFIAVEGGSTVMSAGLLLQGLSDAASKITVTVFGEEIT